MRKIHSIVIHHSASAKTSTPNEIRGWHKQRGFDDIGYHAIIYKTAGGWILAPGRNESIVGAHCKGFNTGTLGVVICGNYETETMEEPARALLFDVLLRWCKTYKIPSSEIFGHRDKGTTATACPGKNLYNELPAFRQRVKSVLNA
ncbi:MAG: N-acetylmuramoyl-L-alanine amidase [Candidatus Kapabacteria bacterium]|nr:N-acetylmuramoyl-L-alanine amidase [Candidatus Kapabacteria bacterium]